MRRTINCYVLFVLLCMTLLSLHSAQASDSPGTFFMFTASRFASAQERESVTDVLLHYLRPTDYLSAALVRQEPTLAAAQHYLLATNLVEVERASGNGCTDSKLVIYDGEHWSATPPDEQINLPAAIARGAALVAQSGCHKYGIAPDGVFLGVVSDRCEFHMSHGIIANIDWHGIGLLDIQAQVLLNNRCGATENYVNCVTEITRLAKATEQRPLIAAQLSLRDTPPERMVEAIGRLRGTVDGFYIAYPSNGSLPCTYCSPSNLAIVLRKIRGAP